MDNLDFEQIFINLEDSLPIIVIGIFVAISFIKYLWENRVSKGLEDKIKVIAQSLGYKYIEESKKTGVNKALHELKGHLRGNASRVYLLMIFRMATSSN